jgi:DnaJ-domain-containing protein 1
MLNAHMPKDHYQTLGIGPQAGQDEIRRNYRNLVKRYHPDKHPDDRAVQARFREIQEAYETLSDPVLRDAWLQERWLMASQGRNTSTLPMLTATDILKKLLLIERGFASEDPWRSDRSMRIRKLTDFLGSDQVEILKQETGQLDTVAETLVRCGRHLDPAGIDTLCALMTQLFPTGHYSFDTLTQLRKEKSAAEYWDKWKPLILFITALLACLLIAQMA